MAERRIYADNAATTAVSDAALSAMLPYFKECYGNPSATHSFGTEAKRGLEEARSTVARALGARVNEIYFTSGGTESDNWALYAAAELRKKKGSHIVITEIEHSAVYRTAKEMEKKGFDITFLPVDREGHVTPEQLEDAIRDNTVLVSIMMANNEIGTILPIRELCAVARKRGVLFHTDAVQAAGHIPVDAVGLGVDMLSVSGHKFGGPKGVGALYVNLRTVVPPMIIGGGQEKGRRSGTSNVPGAVGMAAALEDAVLHMGENAQKIAILRDRLISGVLQLPQAELTGDPVHRLPGLASFVFSGVEGEVLVSLLNEAGICVSSGSACSAGSGEPSRVLKAAGYDGTSASAAIRFSLSENNTSDDVTYILAQLPFILEKAKTIKFTARDLDFDGD
ncbi:cysteine desulfurase [Sporobacter termitidis DSM 10068]|uniref:cysteine desulfurase n=1 Tax=Sporobacter termitidis DSM 10068 TaxID=1123282 RepID=A0A1M5TRP8_9FIRM|nr:cysteine desulfurase family protein [Sporobacter termitidis]SHH53442.1 cysteine desulfurase [Sporobacter termitidis DSM 10068]